jgi:hypothetical protein
MFISQKGEDCNRLTTVDSTGIHVRKFSICTLFRENMMIILLTKTS